eukprot:maker-scaffold_6-snap-gene-15.19-mRNA-1 protein AED:0.01 eAED:0.01 QI:358/1/1/1/0.5/0.33/3/236/530
MISHLIDEERAKYIPLRLTHDERMLLRVIQGALEVSSYTDAVDVSTNNYFARSRYDKSEIIIEELEDIFQVINGLSLCNTVTSKLNTCQGKAVFENTDFYATCFEIARRYKIMNPDKMRTTYGKLLYIMMDCENPKVKRKTKVNLRRKIKTVYRVLEKANSLPLLKDPAFQNATRPVDKTLTASISEQLAEREKAIKEVVEKYAEFETPKKAKRESKVAEKDLTSEESSNNMEISGESSSDESVTSNEGDNLPETLSEEMIRLIVDSILDNHSFLETNVVPILKLLNLLKLHFDPSNGAQHDLTIKSGKNGSCLSHGHTTQFNFVFQSLTLWKNIISQFFQAWMLAERDLLLPGNGYSLTNTGQGLQRCQRAPNVSRFMSTILGNTKAEVKKHSETYGNLRQYGREWVGLSVVHLGDRDVPNALVFIDKYTQISRMLVPLVQVVEKLRDLPQQGYGEWLNKDFNGVKNLEKEILADYFKHGFDGSGDDGGSCIDGRLTSTWNWCSKLEKKNYFPVFLFCGFLGFDGDFRE